MNFVPRHSVSFVVLVALFAVLCSLPALAQAPRPPKALPSHTLSVNKLRAVDAAAELMSEFDVDIDYDDDKRVISFRGNRALRHQVEERLRELEKKGIPKRAKQMPEGTRMFPLQHVRATDVKTFVTKEFKPKALAVERLNNAIIVGDNPEKLNAIAAFIQSIDRPWPDSWDELESKLATNHTRVVFLEHLSPTDAAAHIKTHFSSRKVKSYATADEARGAVMLSGPRHTLNEMESALLALDIPVTGITTGMVPVYFQDVRRVRDIVKTHFIPNVVEADEDNRLLVVTAAPAVLDDIHRFVRQFDQEPPTILVEGTILNVNHNKAKQIGVKLGHQFERSSSSTSQDGFSSKSTGTVDLLRDRVTSEFPIPNVFYEFTSRNGKSYSVQVAALVETGAAEIVLKPHITFLSGRTGDFQQNQNIPQVSSSPDRGTNVNTLKTGLTLKVGGVAVPMGPADEDGEVPYKIVLDKLRITDGRKGDQVTASDTTAIAFFSNEVIFESPQIVDDGELIILGGAINKDRGEAIQKIPILGDIPLIRTFFRFRSKTGQDTETLALLRLTVIRENHYQYKASQYDISKDLRPVEFGGDVNDSIHEHPLKTSKWSSEIVYKRKGGYFEKIHGKFDDARMEQIDRQFKKRIRGRIKIVHEWQNSKLLKMLIERDEGLSGAFSDLAKEFAVTPHEVLIVARHLGSINDPVYVLYMDFLKHNHILLRPPAP